MIKIRAGVDSIPREKKLDDDQVLLYEQKGNDPTTSESMPDDEGIKLDE